MLAGSPLASDWMIDARVIVWCWVSPISAIWSWTVSILFWKFCSIRVMTLAGVSLV